MKLSARNVLTGRVKELREGAVNAEVVIELSVPGQLTSIITLGSAKGLELAEGKKVYAVIKASQIIVAVDD